MSVVAQDQYEGEIVEREFITNDAVASLNKSEIDVQIQTAKRYPRSLTQFKRDAMEMATLDEQTAGTMFYVVPRGDKDVEGPSVRLAEVVGCCWGNLRYAARIIDIGERFVTAQGMCFDLQKNIAASVEVQRRITNKKGVRFNDDLIQVTANAACSIALRQAIFKVVPFAFVKPIYEAARRTSVGDSSSFSTKRANAIEWFKKAGGTEAAVLAKLGHKGIEDITVDDLITLKGLQTGIIDGDTTVEEALGVQLPGGKKAKPSELNDTLGKPAQQPAKKEPKPDPTSQINPDAEDVIQEAPAEIGEEQFMAGIKADFEAMTMVSAVNDRRGELTADPSLNESHKSLVGKWADAALERIRNSRGQGSNK